MAGDRFRTGTRLSSSNIDSWVPVATLRFTHEQWASLKTMLPIALALVFISIYTIFRDGWHKVPIAIRVQCSLATTVLGIVRILG